MPGEDGCKAASPRPAQPSGEVARDQKVNSMQNRIRLSTTRRGVLGVVALLLGACLAQAQSVPVVTGDARVDKLLSQMTLEEKLTLIHGTHEDPAVYQGQAGYLGGIPRLGIPGLRFADGPPGVLTRHPSQGETATMGVAATFSRKTGRRKRPGDRPRRPRAGHRRLAAALCEHRPRPGVRPRLQHLRRRPVSDRRDGRGRDQGHPVAARHGADQALRGLRLRTAATSSSTTRRCTRSMWRPSTRPSGARTSRRSCAPTIASTAPSPAATSPR